MARRIDRKDEKLGIRISTKLKFGIDLIARKYRTSESEAVARCVEIALANEGFAELDPDAPFSQMDFLWATSQAERSLRIADHAPELATQDEKRVLIAYKALAKRYAPLTESLGLPMPYAYADELVPLIRGYLGLADDSDLAKDEDAYLLQCDEAVRSATPDIDTKSLDQFREKYVSL